MAKTSIQIDKEKEALYRKLVNPKLMEELRDKIQELLVVRKKYHDHGYTASKMAEELHTNSRYVTAVIRVHFHTTYTSLVNKYRIEEAMAVLTDSRYAHLNVEDVGDMVGFAHRQSFYTAFTRYVGTTPRAYRLQVMKCINND